MLNRYKVFLCDLISLFFEELIRYNAARFYVIFKLSVISHKPPLKIKQNLDIQELIIYLYYTS